MFNEIAMVVVILAAVIGTVKKLDQWEKERERKRLVEIERERLAPYQFCNSCGIPLADDEKMPMGSSTVCCYDCARSSIRS